MSALGLHSELTIRAPREVEELRRELITLGDLSAFGPAEVGHVFSQLRQLHQVRWNSYSEKETLTRKICFLVQKLFERPECAPYQESYHDYIKGLIRDSYYESVLLLLENEIIQAVHHPIDAEGSGVQFSDRVRLLCCSVLASAIVESWLKEPKTISSVTTLSGLEIISLCAMDQFISVVITSEQREQVLRLLDEAPERHFLSRSGLSRSRQAQFKALAHQDTPDEFNALYQRELTLLKALNWPSRQKRGFLELIRVKTLDPSLARERPIPQWWQSFRRQIVEDQKQLDIEQNPGSLMDRVLKLEKRSELFRQEALALLSEPKPLSPRKEKTGRIHTQELVPTLLEREPFLRQLKRYNERTQQQFCELASECADLLELKSDQYVLIGTGSYAHEIATLGSDVDVVVVYQEEVTRKIAVWLRLISTLSRAAFAFSACVEPPHGHSELVGLGHGIGARYKSTEIPTLWPTGLTNENQTEFSQAYPVFLRGSKALYAHFQRQSGAQLDLKKDLGVDLLRKHAIRFLRAEQFHEEVRNYGLKSAIKNERYRPLMLGCLALGASFGLSCIKITSLLVALQGKIDSHFLRVLEHAFIRVMKYRTQLAADDFNLKTPQDFEPSSLYWESFFYRVLIPLLMSYRFLGHAVPKNFDPALWLYRAFLKSHGDVSTFEPLSSTELIDFVLTYQAHCEANPVQYMKDMRAISEKSLSIKRLYLDRLKIRLKNELMFLGQDERYPPIQRAVENVLSPLGYRVSTGETRGNWHQRLFFTLIPITDIRGEEEHLVSLRTLDLAAMSVMPYGGWTQEVRTYRLPSSLERFLWNQDDLEAQLSSPSGFRFFNGCDAFQLESLCTVLTDTDLILRFLGGGVFHALPAQLKMRDRIFSVLLTEPLSMRVETLDDDENAMWRFVLTQVLLGGVANGVANSCFLQPLRSEHWRNPPRADLIEFQAGPSLPVRDSEVAYGYQTLSIRQALRDWREHGQILVPVLRSLGMSVRGIDPSHFKRVAERALFLKHVLKRGDVLTLEDVWRAFHNREKTELKRMVKIAPNSPIKCVGKVRANHFGPAFPQFDEKRANGEQTSFLKYLMDFPLDLSKWNVEEFKSLSEPLKLKLIEKWCRRAERQLREFQKNSKSSQAELIKIAEEKYCVTVLNRLLPLVDWSVLNFGRFGLAVSDELLKEFCRNTKPGLKKLILSGAVDRISEGSLRALCELIEKGVEISVPPAFPFLSQFRQSGAVLTYSHAKNPKGLSPIR